MPPYSPTPPALTPDPLTPQPAAPRSNDQTPAVELIRQKVSDLYGEEPAAKQELVEAEHVAHRSKHQEFMHALHASGKDLVTIQTQWHEYYQSLPAHEKHQVWHEFYASQSLLTHPAPVTQHHAQPAPPPPATPELLPLPPSQSAPSPKIIAAHKHEASTSHREQKLRRKDGRSASQIRAAIQEKVSAGGKLEAKHHIQSLLFGLGMGSSVLVIFLFSFFNEVVLAPFIQPSRAQAATPLIIGTNAVPPSTQPEVIIPKINVEIPTDYSQNTTDENQIENALDSGVVHYPTTVRPGQLGNAAYFGHSSNNIFNKGKYKFAFVLLHTVVPGDTFYLTYNAKVYVYKVFSRTVVDPSDVGVLGPVSGHAATATLITCDPPGTSLKRLIIVGDQISPDPSGNSHVAAPTGITGNGPATSATLPGNGKTLFARFFGGGIGQTLSIVIILLAIGMTVRTMRRTPRTTA